MKMIKKTPAALLALVTVCSLFAASPVNAFAATSAFDLSTGTGACTPGVDYNWNGAAPTVLATPAGGKRTLKFGLNGDADLRSIITVSDASATGPEKPKNPYNDVIEGDWFYDAALYMYEHGVMIGMGEEKFAPNTDLSRAMMLQILYNLAGNPDVSGLPNPFDDVPEGMWFADAIKWACANDITIGYGDGNFGINDPVTNEQLARFIYSFQQSSGKKPPDILMDYTHPDWDMISGWAKNAVNVLTIQGIFRDWPGIYFNPQTPASREAVASALYRYLSAAK